MVIIQSVLHKQIDLHTLTHTHIHIHIHIHIHLQIDMHAYYVVTGFECNMGVS